MVPSCHNSLHQLAVFKFCSLLSSKNNLTSIRSCFLPVRLSTCLHGCFFVYLRIWQSLELSVSICLSRFLSVSLAGSSAISRSFIIHNQTSERITENANARSACNCTSQRCCFHIDILIWTILIPDPRQLGNTICQNGQLDTHWLRFYYFDRLFYICWCLGNPINSTFGTLHFAPA